LEAFIFLVEKVLNVWFLRVLQKNKCTINKSVKLQVLLDLRSKKLHLSICFENDHNGKSKCLLDFYIFTFSLKIAFTL